MFTGFFNWLFRRKPKAAPGTVLPTAQTVAPMPPVRPVRSCVVEEPVYVPVDDGIDIIDIIETVAVVEAIEEETQAEQSYYDNSSDSSSWDSGSSGGDF